MGVRLEKSPHLWRLMDPADQARYGVVPGTLSCVRDDAPKCSPKRSPKRDADERKQQGEFASWLSLQRSKGRKIPFVWHATHTRSKATPGCPDFWVGVAGRGIWFEFKRDADEKKEQGEFASWLSLQNSKGRRIPFCWHATHTRSKATPGVPDFWVGVAGRGLWFEFKKDRTCKLTTEQEEFRSACEAQRIEHYLVYSSQQAVDIVETAAGPEAPSAALRSRVTIGGTVDADELL